MEGGKITEEDRMISPNDYTTHDQPGRAGFFARREPQPEERGAAAFEVVEQAQAKRQGYLRHMAISITMVIGLVALNVHAQSWQPPADNQRCPSKWGAGDERGAANHMKPETVLRATRLIKSGEVIELGQVLSASIPFVGTRRFDVHTKRTFMNQASNRRGSNEEVLISEIGQVGTQFDGFAHQTIEDKVYNCFKVDEIASRGGFTKLGIDKVGALITRGVLIDVAGLKGADILPDTYEITVQDLEGALQRQKLQLQPGDAVVIHTGWGKLWGKDNARYGKSCPGIGVQAAEWLARQDPMLVGSDTWPVEVFPNPDTQVSAPVHQIMLVVNGIYLLENMKLEELAAKGVHEFAFIMQPLKLQGFSGSTVAPIAVR
jgi:kynurenine formamidase